MYTKKEKEKEEGKGSGNGGTVGGNSYCRPQRKVDVLAFVTRHRDNGESYRDHICGTQR